MQLFQVAKALGARVLATVRSTEKSEFVKSVGADRVIVTSEEDFVLVAQKETGGQGVDVIIDGIGGVYPRMGFTAIAILCMISPISGAVSASRTEWRFNSSRYFAASA